MLLVWASYPRSIIPHSDQKALAYLTVSSACR